MNGWSFKTIEATKVGRTNRLDFFDICVTEMGQVKHVLGSEIAEADVRIQGC